MINVRSREGEGTTITVELPCEYRGDSPAESIEDIDATLEPSRLKSFLNIKHIESVETEISS
ncbi:MAG: hypothetical protein M3Q99_19820, partial [Acidobacteriota bacterium]|nr:hypothetical protein [Acidobacteriota bacterium]